MRRLLLILLLAFMPLQSIWAAAAGYCSHEETPGAAHFGNHVHQHHEDGDGAKAGTDLATAVKTFDAAPFKHLQHVDVWLPQLVNRTYLEMELE